MLHASHEPVTESFMLIIWNVEHKNMFYADYTFQSVSTSTTRTHNPTQQTIQQKYIDGFDFCWSNPAVYT